MTEQELHIKIDRYLKRTMTSGEREEFEQQLALDPLLRQVFDAQLQEHALQESLRQYALKERMKGWDRKLAGERTILLKIAVPLLLCLLLAGILWKTLSGVRRVPTEKEQQAIAWHGALLPDYLQAEAFGKTQKSGEAGATAEISQEPDSWRDAIAAYRADRLNKLHREISTLPDTSLYYWPGQEMLAHAYFKDQRYKEAARLFDVISAAEAAGREDYALGFAAIAYYLAGDSQRAKERLATINRDEGHPLHLGRSISELRDLLE